MLATALGYWCLAIAADYLSFPGSLTAIWPASGLAAAAAVVFGYRIWPGILAGVFLNQMGWWMRSLSDAAGSNPWWAEFLSQSLTGLSYAMGNCLEALLIAYLLRRFNGVGNPLEGAGNVIRFIVLAALIGPILGSLAGTLVTCGLWGWVPWSAFWSAAWTWWVSAAAGILVVAPPLLFLYYDRPMRPHWSRGNRVEAVALLLLSTLILGVIVRGQYPLEYLMLPVMLWSAFRFGQSATSWLSGALMLVVIFAATHDNGYFAAEALHASGSIQALTLLQCFIATLIATAMIVSAVIADRQHAARALIELNATLEQRIAARTRELEVARTTAEAADRAKGQFLATASHDLGQPLHTVSYFVDALQFELHDSNERRTRLAELRQIGQKLRASVDHMRGLFGTMLDISRLEAGTIVPHCSDFALGHIVSAIERDCSPLALVRGLHWSCECPEVRIHSDPVLLERVLRNLVDNALKYTGTGTIALRVTGEGDDVAISIGDSGVGIAQERHLAVFDAFYRIEIDDGGDSEGLGLGLAIVKRLCDLLGHRLDLQSATDVGTTVTVTVSAAASARPA